MKFCTAGVISFAILSFASLVAAQSTGKRVEETKPSAPPPGILDNLLGTQNSSAPGAQKEAEEYAKSSWARIITQCGDSKSYFPSVLEPSRRQPYGMPSTAPKLKYYQFKVDETSPLWITNAENP